MKIREAFVLRQVAEQWVAMPVGKAAAQGSYMVKLNATAAWAWQQLQKPLTREALINRLLDTYNVTPEQAQKDVDSLLDFLRSLDALEE